MQLQQMSIWRCVDVERNLQLAIVSPGPQSAIRCCSIWLVIQRLRVSDEILP